MSYAYTPPRPVDLPSMLPVVDMLNRAKSKGLHYPKLWLEFGARKPLRVTLAGEGSRTPGYLLLPDGREAALVPFKDNNSNVEVATYIPMVAGLLKKVRNSGELASLAANPVYAEDFFEYELGDNERIVHRPAWRKERGALVGAYAIARTKDGNIYRRVLGLEDIKLIKAFSKAKKGPWHGAFESETAAKPEPIVVHYWGSQCQAAPDKNGVSMRLTTNQHENVTCPTCVAYLLVRDQSQAKTKGEQT